MSAVIETKAVTPATTTTPPVIDVTALLAPIPGDNPAGESQQYAGVYDEIREARRADDTLAKGEWEREPKVAEWPRVFDLATTALATKTKDLQIAGWLTEALAYLYGFRGLRDGLMIVRGLHEQYWDRLYPEIDDGNLDGRANAISAMDTRLEIPLKNVPLTKSGSESDYSFIQWEESTKFDIPDNLDTLDSDAVERFNALRAEADAGNKTTSETWRKAKDATPRAFFEETFTVVHECWDQFQALDKVMDEKFGNQTPGLGTLKKTLDSIRTLVEKVVKEKRILEPDPVLDGESGTASPDEAARGAGPLKGRAEALRQLAEVAQYFQRTEPHSPVAYLVQRAIKWGQMPLEVWLEEVIKDGATLGYVKETLGLDNQGPGTDSGQSS
ncbi:MAG TPA: type VI secretion system protein TssA [Pyrinomonadaceae bacterium]|nr:type VI secretion system protein TssA [Pyrinomonadaceae bacterium]